MGEASIHRAESQTSPAAVAARRAPKLLDRVRHVIRAKHYSRRTESAYVDWIRRFIIFHQKRHPSEMGATEISTFLTWLATNRRVSASTQNQALSAVLFLYRDVLRVTSATSNTCHVLACRFVCLSSSAAAKSLAS